MYHPAQDRFGWHVADANGQPVQRASDATEAHEVAEYLTRQVGKPYTDWLAREPANRHRCFCC